MDTRVCRDASGHPYPVFASDSEREREGRTIKFYPTPLKETVNLSFEIAFGPKWQGKRPLALPEATYTYYTWLESTHIGRDIYLFPILGCLAALPPLPPNTAAAAWKKNISQSLSA
jgi:hypothetical protein